MNFNEARRWLVLFTLFFTGANFIFFLLGPAFGYPLEQNEAIRMLEIVLPVFLGYLGAATRYLFESGKKTIAISANPELLAILVRGPAILFVVVSIASLIAFGYSNRGSGTGMTPDTLAAMITGNLGLLAVTTNVIIAKLFPK
jgi:hypothetical protein